MQVDLQSATVDESRSRHSHRISAPSICLKPCTWPFQDFRTDKARKYHPVSFLNDIDSDPTRLHWSSSLRALKLVPAFIRMKMNFVDDAGALGCDHDGGADEALYACFEHDCVAVQERVLFYVLFDGSVDMVPVLPGTSAPGPATGTCIVVPAVAMHAAAALGDFHKSHLQHPKAFPSAETRLLASEVPDELQAPCPGATAPARLEHPEHPDEVGPLVRFVHRRLGWDVDQESIVSVVDWESFGTDLSVGAGK